MIRAIRPDAPILVTGCSSGIGQATAMRLAQSPHPVWATARRVDDLAPLAEAGCRVLSLDVTDEASMLAAVRHIEAADGAIGALVNNAGYGEYGPVEEVTMDALRRQFETNVFGLVRLTQLVLPAMRARRSGRIVNVSSMGGRFTLPGGGVYHASKYAVEALSDALRFELRAFGIAVVLIEPGPVRSAFADDATAVAEGAGPYAAFRLGVARRNAASYEGRAARRAIAPDEVAAVIARAIDSERPKARYLVGGVSRLLVALRQVLPDGAWDLLMRSLYPTPGAPT